MNIPIRIIGIATSVFWIFLIIFAITAVYSMKDIQFNLGEPLVSTTRDNELLLSFPVSVANTGYYSLTHVNVTTRVLSKEGLTVADGSTIIPLIKQSQAVNTTHNMKLNLTELLQTDQSLLFNDSELTINKIVDLTAAEFFQVQGSTNSSVPWGAPMYNLVLDTPQFIAYNATHLNVTIPVSFENHAFFDLTGTIQVRSHSSTNALVNVAEFGFEAPQRSRYSQSLQFYVPMLGRSRLRFEVYFATQFFNYGPLVVP